MSSVWSKSRKAAERAFPCAIVALDTQCADLHAYTDTLYRVEKRRGKPHRLCMNVNGYRRPIGDDWVELGRLRLRWHDAAEVWVRYSCAFRTKGCTCAMCKGKPLDQQEQTAIDASLLAMGVISPAKIMRRFRP